MGWKARAWCRSASADAEAEATYQGAIRADTVAAKAIRAALAKLPPGQIAVEIQVRLLSEPRADQPTPMLGQPITWDEDKRISRDGP